MKNFSRITVVKLPSGETAKVFPFHICLKGLESNIICRDEEDYDVLVKYIAICALRKNVIVVIYIVVSNHLHATILASCQEDADAYAEEIKRMASQWHSTKYNIRALLKNVKSSAILLDSDWYLQNTLAYIPRNALDNGANIGTYKWSGYRAMFSSCTPSDKKLYKLSSFSAKQLRKIFHTNDDIRNMGWLLNEQFELEPSSFCFSTYFEAAFMNDEAYFMKRLGNLNKAEMEHKLVDSPRIRMNDSDLFKDADDICRRWFNVSIIDLPVEKKIRVIPYIYRTHATTPFQISRIFAIDRYQVASILGIHLNHEQ